MAIHLILELSSRYIDIELLTLSGNCTISASKMNVPDTIIAAMLYKISHQSLFISNTSFSANI